MSESYAIDLHVHVREVNSDACAGAAEVVTAAARAGLHGLCVAAPLVPDEWRQNAELAGLSAAQVVDRLRRGFDVARAACAGVERPPQVYFGIEYRIPKTVDDVLILGLDPEALTGIDLRQADPWDVRRFVVDRGGLLCAAHPFRHRNHGAPFGGPNMVEAVEVVNGRHSLNNRNDLAARWCQKIGRIALAGSDAHSCCEVGEAVTCLPSVPESNRALGALLRRKQVNDVRQRHCLCLGLQTCRHNGLYIEDELRHTARQGMGAFEIFFDGFMPREIDHKARQRFAAMAAGMGLRLSVMAPLLPLAGDAGRDLLRELVGFAVDVGATLLVVPAGCAVEPPVVIEAVARAREHGILVAIGNGPDLARNCTPQRLVDVLLAVPQAEAALDIGHAQLLGNAARYTDDLLALLAATDRRVVHLQLHDNDGRSDGHLSMGDGTVGLNAVLKSLFDAGFDGTGIIEHWRDPRREREQILQIVCALARPMALVDVDRLAAGPVPSVPPTL